MTELKRLGAAPDAFASRFGDGQEGPEMSHPVVFRGGPLDGELTDLDEAALTLSYVAHVRDACRDVRDRHELYYPSGHLDGGRIVMVHSAGKTRS